MRRFLVRGVITLEVLNGFKFFPLGKMLRDFAGWYWRRSYVRFTMRTAWFFTLNILIKTG